MKIESVTASYSLTQSLADYCNVRPGVTLQASLEPGEQVRQVMDALMAIARGECEQLVDAELEAASLSPRYFEGQRYCLWAADNWTLVLPAEVPGPEWTPQRRGYEHQYHQMLARGGYTWQRAVTLAVQHADSRDAVSLCKDGVIPDEVLHDLETVRCVECRDEVPVADARHGMCPACRAGKLPDEPLF